MNMPGHHRINAGAAAAAAALLVTLGLAGCVGAPGLVPASTGEFESGAALADRMRAEQAYMRSQQQQQQQQLAASPDASGVLESGTVLLDRLRAEQAYMRAQQLGLRE